ncbi:hypothetical protein CVT24_004895, partial [Panaeolus cyanescens]
MMTQSYEQHCEGLRLSVLESQLFVIGTFALEEKETFLFYSSKDGRSGGRINVLTASEQDLAGLATIAGCISPTSRLNTLSASGKSDGGNLHSSNFSCSVCPINHGLMKLVKEDLMNDEDEGPIRHELSSLQIYGPGCHRDLVLSKHASPKAFASIVIALPTKHEGGELIIRNSGERQSFETSNDKASFIIIYDGIEYGTTPPSSGYLVTLTYDIVFTTAEQPSPRTLQHRDPVLDKIKQHLKALLDDPEFLPEGGCIGSHLAYDYKHDETSGKVNIKGPDFRF